VAGVVPAAGAVAGAAGVRPGTVALAFGVAGAAAGAGVLNA
jgi:hypothetical protein